MKFAFVAEVLLLTAFSAATSDAWVPNHNQDNRQCTKTGLMGSRKVDKWESRRDWLESRGFSADVGLSSATSDTASVDIAPAEIIGAGRIGSLLAEAPGSTVLGREDPIDPNKSGPILIATRNDALDGIVDNCPENRKKDLVFMQNGYLDDFLASKGLSDNTQALLYFSRASMDAPAVDGITSENPEGLTAATGVHAQAFADRLATLGLRCKVVTPAEYRPAMFEKLIWISTYMLIGTVKECNSVGQAKSEHSDLVEKLVNELAAATSSKEGISFEAGTLARLNAYTDSVSNFPCAVKEFKWRNQYFYDLGDDAVPTHNELLRECKEKGLIDFDLP